MGSFSKFLLKTGGWKAYLDVKLPDTSFILAVAPHTSLYDALIGRIALTALGLKGKFLIKKEAFRFPLGIILKWLGGLPVDRSHGNSVIRQVVEMLHHKKKFCIVITPEGTRKLTKTWKKGYYFIAQAAQVPVLLGYVDYEMKECRVGKILIPSGNYDEDLKIIQQYYQGRKGKHPERFSLS